MQSLLKCPQMSTENALVPLQSQTSTDLDPLPWWMWYWFRDEWEIWLPAGTCSYIHWTGALGGPACRNSSCFHMGSTGDRKPGEPFGGHCVCLKAVSRFQQYRKPNKESIDRTRGGEATVAEVLEMRQAKSHQGLWPNHLHVTWVQAAGHLKIARLSQHLNRMRRHCNVKPHAKWYMEDWWQTVKVWTDREKKQQASP